LNDGLTDRELFDLYLKASQELESLDKDHSDLKKRLEQASVQGGNEVREIQINLQLVEENRQKKNEELERIQTMREGRPFKAAQKRPS
jgi:hypothetical protein